MDTNKIRKRFLEFFENKGHQIVPSAPMVIKDDPTLMFTNAGMNQFKDIFLNNAPPKNKRVVNTQKCLRVSGKHNDLEEVGVDTYHHTMFEMLGNWSFGDYFKKEAIEWAWELLVDVYGIDGDRLYVTVFEGDDSDNLPKDKETIDVWKTVVNPDRILEFDKKDNFWEMGDTGPCGPCSEIHIDIRDDKERKKIDGKSLVNKNHPEVIELWNLVFIEFNRMASGELKPLPNKHVDTGMGFERLCMILQGKKSNYDTDVFQPMIKEIEKISGKKYGENDSDDIAIRVVADHIRAVAFAIADGQLPYRDGAGYVIRRVLRRAVRYGYSFLDINKPFIHELVSVLIEQMGEQFPEIKAQKELIQKVIKEEEESFLRTLEKGIQRFEKELARLQPSKFKARTTPYFEGLAAFELYDTYGFPVDLTNLIAKENGYAGVDMIYYNRCLQEQKARSKKAAVVDAEDWIDLDQTGGMEFIGYDTLEAEVRIVKYRKVKAKGKEQYQLVFDKTPFYAESGGQVGDTGYIETDGERILINDTKKENNLIIHFADKLPNDLSVTFKALVNKENRITTANNHSATHLLHAALRAVLGDHVEQKGSLVDSSHLRFDFSHFSKVTDEEITEIEKIVNEKIRANIPLDIKQLPLEEAKKLGARALFGEKYGDVVRVVTFDKGSPPPTPPKGGESQPSKKPQYSIKEPLDKTVSPHRGDGRGAAFSIELCGGTHVKATGEIRSFKITNETAIAAGIRRIEAITSKAAEIKNKDQLQKVEKLQNDLKRAKGFTDLLKFEDLVNLKEPELTDEIKKIENIISKIAGLKIQDQLKKSKELQSVIVKPIEDFLNQNNELNKHLEKLRKLRANIIKEQLLNKIQENKGINYIVEKVDLDNASIKSVAFQLKAQIDNLFLVLGAEINGKAHLTVVISDNLVTPSTASDKKDLLSAGAPSPSGRAGVGLNAAEIIREIAKEIQGGGGGQPFYATAGGKNVKGIENALKKAKQLAT